MLHRTRIFKYTTKFTTRAPNQKDEAWAIQIQFLKDPKGIFKTKETRHEAAMLFTDAMLSQFSEVTLSYFENGYRVELLPYQNRDINTIQNAGETIEKIIASIIEKVCISKGWYEGQQFVADSDASGSFTTVSVVEKTL